MEQAPAHDPLIGAQVGNYQIRSKLGEGGMGSVYLAEHPRIGKKVALKVLHAEFSSNQDVTSRFFNEARAVNDIQHPNIVDIIDYGVIPGAGGGMVYFIMEFLQGRALSQVVREEAPLPPERALGICMQIADALAASHRHRIVHRDLKPDNIILQPRGVQQDFVKVLDFGIAKLTGDQPGSRRTRTGIVMGTPAYMSPEQCEGKGQVDHRTDVYALGIVLYELLTGRVPFLGEGYGEVLVQHLTAVPQRPSTIRGVIPAHVEAVCMKALEKRPDQRYPSMEEFMLALRDPVGYVESHGGLAGYTSANLGAPSAMMPTPPPGQLAMATPAPGTMSNYAYPTPSPGANPTPYGAPVPGKSRTGLFVAIGAVGALAIGGGVFAMTRGGGDTPAEPAAAAPVASGGHETPDPVAAAVPEDKKVTIKVSSEPLGAEVRKGGMLIGNTPTEFSTDQSDEPIELSIRMKGFVERREKTIPSENRDLNLRLEAVKVEPPVQAAAATETGKTGSSSSSRSGSSSRTSSRSGSSSKTSSSTSKSTGKTTTGGKTGGKVKTGNNTLEPDF